MTAPHPALPAKIHPLVRAFLDSRDDVDRAVRRAGTPTHLVFPQVFAENVARLRDVLTPRSPRYRICYAHKVNRSRAFVAAAHAAGIGIDVASPWELHGALAAGFAPSRIEVTGPKGEAFLRELVRCGVTVNVDNMWELTRLTELAEDGAQVPVLLRISGFASTPVSRFGIPVDHAADALNLAATHRGRITFRGFAFHLDSGEIAERVRAIDACLTLVESAYAAGLSPTVLNIGGGLRQVFTADADRFDAYVHALRDSLLGRGERMSWADNTFGYHVDDAAVHGTPVFHKYANTVPADRMLADLLDAPLDRHAGRPVAAVAADNLLDLWLEPGKALVDHAGITVARVEFTKELADGTVLVHVDLSRDAVTPADQEVMVDPLLLATAPADPGPVGVFLAGRLCLERDLITQRKVWLPHRPGPGDLLVFPNTAAYHSDLSAASASRWPAAAKFAVVHRGGEFEICPDDEYSPVAARNGAEVM
ncbi:alanine racemase [Nocardia puris]|uniref:Diaminopimelate decarboxylase n=1 Tax=Nocardia puris TaxID=208602 RepID=A0A366DUU4_9NOCA|nr:alanine racemase [Nocardia puris]MBF6210445.1 alanine racemase [Nocardia puris]MBF6367520.1 alanine racemase [Nocardia puris]MBF6457705.1 alanine racemase [Nocardia puris]RBO93870.1 diaminopimelate decarboxylase [Nocardia puris]